MNWKWWLVFVSLVIFWMGHAFANRKENDLPPKPPLDSFPGDTTGVIAIKDSTLIPTFGIYRVGEWGKIVYIDTTTFKKYGMVIFFDPWEEDSRRYVEILSELRSKVENEWGFEVFLVASRMSVVSCREHLSESEYPGNWNCDIFLMSDFKEPHRSVDSLKKALIKLKTTFPVYRLKHPLRLKKLVSEPYHPTILTIKEKYLMYVEPGEKGFVTNLNKTVMKMVFKLGFPAVIKGLEEDWKYVSSKGGEKK